MDEDLGLEQRLRGEAAVPPRPNRHPLVFSQEEEDEDLGAGTTMPRSDGRGNTG